MNYYLPWLSKDFKSDQTHGSCGLVMIILRKSTFLNIKCYIKTFFFCILKEQKDKPQHIDVFNTCFYFGWDH